MPLNPEKYQYNSEVCNKNYEGKHDYEDFKKEIEKFL